MHLLSAPWIRQGLCILFCAALSGCVVDGFPDGQPQSMEAAVQTVLARQGYYRGPVDGAIGPATSRAIRAYQRDHQLAPTGTITSAVVVSMGLAGSTQASVGYAPYFRGYSYPSYGFPALFAPPAVIGLGWGSLGWGGNWGYGGNCYNRGYGNYGRSYGGYYNRGYGNYGRGYGGYSNRGYGNYGRGYGNYGHGWSGGRGYANHGGSWGGNYGRGGHR